DYLPIDTRSGLDLLPIELARCVASVSAAAVINNPEGDIVRLCDGTIVGCMEEICSYFYKNFWCCCCYCFSALFVALVVVGCRQRCGSAGILTYID
ncbi:hypothetical protein LSH36_212g02000, partial [Paralvinella palmiformis]